MTCGYPECPNAATFACTCTGEGISEAKDLCADHKNLAETICAIFGWILTVKPIAKN